LHKAKAAVFHLGYGGFLAYMHDSLSKCRKKSALTEKSRNKTEKFTYISIVFTILMQIDETAPANCKIIAAMSQKK